MKASKELPIIGAAEKMEYLFQSGIYQRRKNSKDCLQQLKYLMRQTVNEFETNRNEFYGVVAKFIRVPVYETDFRGLKEFINDLGLLPKVVNLKYSHLKEDEDLEEVLDSFKLPSEPYVQLFLNSKGKHQTIKREYLFDPSFEGMAVAFLNEKKEYERSEQEYQNILQQMKNCPLLKHSISLKCNYGTVKLMKREIEYDVESIYNEFGAKFLLDYGQISMEGLEYYVTNGFLSHKEINTFRKQVDIQVKFVVMDLETERKSMEYIYNKKMTNAQIRRFA